MVRTLREQALDKLLLLLLVNQVGRPIGDTGLQKLAFLAERELLGNSMEGFHYVFIKLKFGPYSRDLEQDKADLVFSEFLEDHEERGWVLSEKGRMILEQFKPVLDRNKSVVEVIRGAVSRYADLRLKDLLEFTHQLPRPLKGRKVAIGELANGTVLLVPHKPDKLLDVSEEEFLKLRIYLDPDVEEVLERRVLDREVLLVRYRGESGFCIFVPSLPKCVTQGESEEEALRNAEEAISLFLEAMTTATR